MRQLKSLLAAALALLLLLSLPVNGRAVGESPYEGGSANYYGPRGVPDAGPGDNPYWQTLDVEVYGELRDFFGPAGKDMYPGDIRTVNIRLVNHSTKTATFYLMVAARTTDGYAPGQGGPAFDGSFDNGEGKSTNVEPYFPGKTAYDAVLDNVQLTMSCDGVEFYNGTLGGTPASGDAGPYGTVWHHLGTAASGAEKLIQVVIEPPLMEIGNDYQETLGALDWVFQATEETGGGGTSTPKPSPSPTPTGTPTPTPTDPPTEQPSTPPSPDPSVSPGPSTPPTKEPGDEDITVVVPPGKLPQTGGLMNFATPMGLAAFLILFLLILTWRRERRVRKARGVS